MIRLLSALKLKTTKKLLASLDSITKLDRKTTRDKKKEKSKTKECEQSISILSSNVTSEWYPPIPWKRLITRGSDPKSHGFAAIDGCFRLALAMSANKRLSMVINAIRIIDRLTEDGWYRSVMALLRRTRWQWCKVTCGNLSHGG